MSATRAAAVVPGALTELSKKVCNIECRYSKLETGKWLHPPHFSLLIVPLGRGWGLRSLDDIPKGTFVCTYIGHVYSEEVGNELGTRDGDEYQAELDYIGESSILLIVLLCWYPHLVYVA